MPEQESPYHPAVKRLFETSGPDMGRVKDKGVAENVAREEDNIRGDSPSVSEQTIKETTERNTEDAVFDEAWGQGPAAHSLASMHASIDSYQQLVADAKPAHDQAEAARAKLKQLQDNEPQVESE